MQQNVAYTMSNGRILPNFSSSTDSVTIENWLLPRPHQAVQKSIKFGYKNLQKTELKC